MGRDIVSSLLLFLQQFSADTYYILTPLVFLGMHAAWRYLGVIPGKEEQEEEEEEAEGLEERVLRWLPSILILLCTVELIFLVHWHDEVFTIYGLYHRLVSGHWMTPYAFMAFAAANGLGHVFDLIAYRQAKRKRSQQQQPANRKKSEHEKRKEEGHVVDDASELLKREREALYRQGLEAAETAARYRARQLHQQACVFLASEIVGNVSGRKVSSLEELTDGEFSFTFPLIVCHDF